MDAQNNLLVKFADDITTSAPVKSRSDSAAAEVESIHNWSEANQMTLNLSKTWDFSALQKKYLDRIDKFFRRAYRYGYTTKSIKISEVIEERDRKLFRKIVSNPEHALHELLPVRKKRILRQREHNFILPQIKTERFKRSFINRCLFNCF